MYGSTEEAITAALSVSLELSVRSGSDLSSDESALAHEALLGSPENTATFTLGRQRFICAAYDGLSKGMILAGPYRLAGDPESEARVLGETEVPKVHSALSAAAEGLRQIIEEPRLRLELARQMEILSSAIVAISGELQLETVLRRITDLARSLASAKYAAVGVPGAQGGLETFITAGMTEDEEARIGRPPAGLGILGLLFRDNRSIRLDDLSQHPYSVGFPAHHPPMKSFLGVPITSRAGTVIGGLYLSEKRFRASFTYEDELLIELLARHAAVAIENAKLYRRLEGEERRLEQILDQLPEAVMLVERDEERVVVMNRRARWLLDVERAVPVPLTVITDRCAFTGPDDEGIRIDDTELMKSIRAGIEVSRAEMAITTAAGRRRTLLVNSAPIKFETVPDACICVFQDITEIRDADRIKDDFLSLVSHELRTPLTTIHGGAQLLLDRTDQMDDGLRNEILTDMNQESARLAGLIQNMVQLTHVRAGRVAFEPEPVLLRMLVERCVNQLSSLDSSRNFIVDVTPDAVAMADADRVDEMLRNVIQNSLKYTPEGTPIEIEGRPHSSRVELSVRDHGPGIPKDEVGEVFERFERGSRASDSSGMGLGLYLVRLLVEAQSGTVKIELPDDGGTRVVFSLPRAEVDE